MQGKSLRFVNVVKFSHTRMHTPAPGLDAPYLRDGAAILSRRTRSRRLEREARSRRLREWPDVPCRRRRSSSSDLARSGYVSSRWSSAPGALRSASGAGPSPTSRRPLPGSGRMPPGSRDRKDQRNERPASFEPSAFGSLPVGRISDVRSWRLRSNPCRGGQGPQLVRRTALEIRPIKPPPGPPAGIVAPAAIPAGAPVRSAPDSRCISSRRGRP